MAWSEEVWKAPACVWHVLKCSCILLQVPANRSKSHSYSMFFCWLCPTEIRDCRNRVEVLKAPRVSAVSLKRGSGPEKPISAATTSGKRFGVQGCQNSSGRGSRDPGWRRPGQFVTQLGDCPPSKQRPSLFLETGHKPSLGGSLQRRIVGTCGQVPMFQDRVSFPITISASIHTRLGTIPAWWSHCCSF